MKCSRTK